VSASEVTTAKVEVALGYEQRADAAAAAVLRRLLEVVRDNLEGAVAGDDDEYLHQLRIAVRRSRTVQRQFKGVFPALELPGFRSELRWLQRATGPARDLDVSLEEFDELAALVAEAERPALEPLRQALVARRLAVRARLEHTLRSVRLHELFADWERLLESLVELPLDDRPTARRSIGSLTGERVVAVYERILTMGRRIEPDSPAERFHELRKKGKELRYLLELFGARVYEPEVVTPLVRTLKDLQDVLGRHQDREVQVLMLRELAGEVAILPGGPLACLAMGGLRERLLEDEHAARAQFAERFAALADPDRHALVTDTFR
jgi:CHAD domain-containing protein